MNYEGIKEALKRNKVTHDTKISVAFSGGPDSVFLVDSLYNLGYRPLLIYINYHDSEYVDKERDIVMKTINKYKLPLIEDNTYIEPNENFEDSARKYRYKLFLNINKEHDIKYLLTGHQLDDVIETYIMQKERKNIVEYYGIKENTILNNGLNVIRPILSYRKKDIIDYLNENNIPYFDDPTNRNYSHRRNFLRQEIINQDVSKLVERIEGENKYINYMNKKIKKLILIDDCFYTTRFNFFAKYEKLRAIYLYLKEHLGYSEKLNSEVNIIYERLKSNKSFIETFSDKSVIYDGEKMSVIPKDILSFYDYEISAFGQYSFPLFDIEIKPNNFNIKSFPIHITCPKKGDVISTNIKQNDAINFIKKMKVPSYLRPFYPVIKDSENKIIYIPYYNDILEEKLPIKLKLH